MSIYPGPNRFDIVGMDPRGTGRSTLVACQSDIRNVPPPVVPRPGDPETEFERAVATFAAGCAEDPNLAFFGSNNVARDIDRLREFLGAGTITYFGKSYGSDLGATYLSLFPSRVRAMVLDGATDLTLEPTDFYIQQARALQRQVDRYMEHCRDVGCRWTNGLDPAAAWAQLTDRLEATPASGGGGDDLTAGELIDFTEGFRDTPYEQIDAALDRLVIDADPIPILDTQDDHSTWDDDDVRLMTAFVTTTCLDLPIESYRDSARRLYDAVPAAPADNAAILAYCGAWPTADPVVIQRSQDGGPVLVVSTRGDVETPYESGVGLAAALGHATLLTSEANTHTAYLGSECIRAIVDTFLTELTIPAPNTSCPDDETPSTGPDGDAADVVAPDI
jgi:pimeloyl-ACP methyl ester carboxylesterase